MITFHTLFGFLLVVGATCYASRGLWHKAFGAPLQLKLVNAIILEKPELSALTFYRVVGRVVGLAVALAFAISFGKDATLATGRGDIFSSWTAFFYRSISRFLWFEFTLHFVGFVEDMVALKWTKVSSGWAKGAVEYVGQAARSMQGMIQRLVLGPAMDFEDGTDDDEY